MAEYIDVEIKGLREINKNLAKLGSNIQKKAAQQMSSATSSSFARTVRKNCPVVTGTLKKSIKSVKRKADDKGVFYQVGFTTGRKAKYNGYYSHIVEFGAAEHTIPRKGESKLMRVGRNWFTGPIHHPGATPRRFVTRSFEEGQVRALAAGRRAFERALKKYGTK